MASAAAAATGSVSMVGGSTVSTPAGTPISKAQAAKKAFDNKWAALRGKVHTIVKDVRHDGDDKTAAKSMAGAVDKASMPPAKRLPHVTGARKLRRVSLNMQQLTSAIKTIGVAGLRNNIIQVYRALLNKTPVTRTEADVQIIAELTKQTKFFKKFNAVDHEALCRVLTLESFRARGLKVVKQGERGHKFYIVLAGAVSVFVHKAKDSVETPKHQLPSGTPRASTIGVGDLVWRYGVGDSFGELALSDPKCIRKATVVTDEPTDLLVLGKDEYTSIVERIHSVEYVEAKTFLRSVPALAALSDDIIARVARVAQKRVFSIDEFLCREGDIVDRLNFMYVIKRGEAHVLKALDFAGVHPTPKRYANGTGEAQYVAERRALRDQRSKTPTVGGLADLPPSAGVLCTMAPRQIMVEPTAMNSGTGGRDDVRTSRTPSPAKRRRRGSLSEHEPRYTMSVRAATRLEALAVSRYDFNKFVRRNGVVIDSVVEGAMVAPSRKEFTALWENNRQWELYKQKLVKQVVSDNAKARSGFKFRAGSRSRTKRAAPPKRQYAKRRRSKTLEAINTAHQAASTAAKDAGAAGLGSTPKVIIATPTVSFDFDVASIPHPAQRQDGRRGSRSSLGDSSQQHHHHRGSSDSDVATLFNAHKHGFLSDTMRTDARFGALRVSPMVEARMFKAMGEHDLAAMHEAEDNDVSAFLQARHSKSNSGVNSRAASKHATPARVPSPRYQSSAAGGAHSGPAASPLARLQGGEAGAVEQLGPPPLPSSIWDGAPDVVAKRQRRPRRRSRTLQVGALRGARGSPKRSPMRGYRSAGASPTGQALSGMQRLRQQRAGSMGMRRQQRHARAIRSHAGAGAGAGAGVGAGAGSSPGGQMGRGGRQQQQKGRRRRKQQVPTQSQHGGSIVAGGGPEDGRDPLMSHLPYLPSLGHYAQ